MAHSNHVAVVEKEFDRVLHDRLLRTVFQPIVNVDSEAVVGYEALIRGPAGSIMESPDALINEAYRQDRVVELTGFCEPRRAGRVDDPPSVGGRLHNEGRGHNRWHYVASS